MYTSILIGLLLSLLVVAQDYDDDKTPGYGEQDGYGPDDDKKTHPPSGYTNRPYGYDNRHSGYNRHYYPNPTNQYGHGYKPRPSYGNTPYNPYHYQYADGYESCKPDYESYSDYDKHHMKYLETSNEYELNKNDSLFKHENKSSDSYIPSCEEGPKHIVHDVPHEWHWPVILKGTCDSLPGCKYSKCIAKKTVKKAACVLVFRKYGYKWVRIGYRKITFKSDVECKCRQCSDIKSFRECVHTHPCPNTDNKNKYSYCFWKRPYAPYGEKKDTYNVHEDPYSDHKDSYERSKPDNYNADKKGYGTQSYKPNGYGVVPAGHCDCCYPQLCIPPMRFDYDRCKCVCPKKKCLPGHTFNPVTCKCDCPKGTYLDKEKQKCVGICKKLDSKTCQNVLCKDNPHLYCQLDKNYNCRCPSCEDIDVWQKDLCQKTDCTEQGYKPNCVFDWRNGNCRCPECEDQKTPQQCEKTSCIDPYKKKTKCRWVWYPYPACTCSKYESSEHKKPTTGYGDKKE